MNILIDLDPQRLHELVAWAKSQGISRADAVGCAIDLLIEHTSVPKVTGLGAWAESLTPARRASATSQYA